MKKKLLACVLSATIVACQSGLFVGADYMPKAKGTGNLIKLEGEKIDEYVKNVALGWANNTNPELKLKATDVKKVMQINSSDPEYAVSFYSGKTPYGYAVVLFKDNEATVKESVVEKNEKSVYDNLIDVVEDEKGTSEKNLDIGKKVLELAPMQYGIVADYKSEKSNPINSNIYDVYGNEIPAVQVAEENKEQVLLCSYNENRDIFIDSYKIENKPYYISKNYSLKKFEDKKGDLITKNKVRDAVSLYCCAVQALYQISFMEKLTSNSSKDIKTNYKKLWNYCKVETDKTSGNFKEGGTSIENASSGFVKFAKSKGYKHTTKKIVNNPKYSWIAEQMKNNKPVLMGYGILVKGKESGHAISILGCYKAYILSPQGIPSRSDTYLKVYNSWDAIRHYVNYTHTDLTFCQMAAFTVKK